MFDIKIWTPGLLDFWTPGTWTLEDGRLTMDDGQCP